MYRATAAATITPQSRIASFESLAVIHSPFNPPNSTNSDANSIRPLDADRPTQPSSAATFESHNREYTPVNETAIEVAALSVNPISIWLVSDLGQFYMYKSPLTSEDAKNAGNIRFLSH